jgi:hypothetical protein
VLFTSIGLVAATATTQLLAGDWQVQLNPVPSPTAWSLAASAQIVRLLGSIQSQDLGNDISTESALKWGRGVTGIHKPATKTRNVEIEANVSL